MIVESDREQLKTPVEKVLAEHLALADKFEEPPKIKLKLLSQKIPDLSVDTNDFSLAVTMNPISGRDIAVSTAYQCFSPGVSEIKPRTGKRALAVANSTLDAGHLTTRQHQSITWKLVGASRSVTHDLLHANPFYNTEQQSQRYVEAKKGGYIMPTELTEQQREAYEGAATFANEAYFELLEKLQPEVTNRIDEMYPTDGWRVEETSSRLELKGKKFRRKLQDMFCQ